MVKFGEGLGIELVKAVKRGEIQEPLNTREILEFCKVRKWKISENYINVFLANTTSDSHSHTYKKYFDRIEKGKYVVANEYRNNCML